MIWWWFSATLTASAKRGKGNYGVIFDGWYKAVERGDDGAFVFAIKGAISNPGWLKRKADEGSSICRSSRWS